MSSGFWLFNLLATSLVPALLIFALPESWGRLRTALNLLAAVSKIAIVGFMLSAVYAGESLRFSYMIAPGLELALKADALALLFVSLSALLWLLTTLYAIGYLEDGKHRSRFFGFFSLCVTATMGIATAANLFTFFIFYELLTLATYPLVFHKGSHNAAAGVRTYLIYTLVAGAAFMAAVVWLHGMVGHTEFTQGGFLAAANVQPSWILQLLFLVLVLSVGVKAALVPLHGWLPQAMVAPAPVSALLHAVAVVKAGAFGIVRIVYEVYGVEYANSLGLLLPLGLAAAVTIVWGSVRALSQDSLKKRLAFSTVSQASYIALGVALFGPLGTIGGLVHLVHQGIMKITLFFCAGNYANTLGVHNISQMDGIGRRMPLTSLAFTIAALGMMGAPFTAGAVTKHWLGEGAYAADMVWAYWVLWISSGLNAAYFLPVIWRAWFRPISLPWPLEAIPWRSWRETHLLLLIPPATTALLTLVAAALADFSWSPLAWAQLIAEREYMQLP